MTEADSMYYPLLRGRQNELLALQELLSHSALSSKIVPIIEPVKLSPTLVNTVEAFVEANHPLVFIANPKVGSFYIDNDNPKNASYHSRLEELGKNYGIVQRGLIVDKKTPAYVTSYKSRGIPIESIFALCLEPDAIESYKESFSNVSVKTVVPFAPTYRRIRADKILIDDKFNKKDRNTEYSNPDDEFFSDDHLYTDGYIGFSDYSVIGMEYNDAGFAPYAIAIHIVYFDSDQSLRIHHFVSDSNEDTSDPAGKLYEALQKLHAWNSIYNLDTLGIKQLEAIYQSQSYPGLGVVKKLSIMHHLELIGRFLDGDTI